jgi:hypothetical protein
LDRICVFQQVARIAIVALGLPLSGCGKPETTPAGTPPEKGTLQTAVEGFTGKTAIDYGLKAKEQIKKANEKEIRDRNEAME